jgi:hypothetical protein
MTALNLPVRDDKPIESLNSASDKAVAFGHALRDDFLFDKNYLNLNHGTSPIPFNTSPAHQQ